MKEKKDKSDLVVTGSNDVATEPVKEPEHILSEKSSAQTIEEKINELSGIDGDQVADIMEQILNLTQVETSLAAMPAEPSYILTTLGRATWLYSITRRAFFEVANGSEILSIEQIDDVKSQCMIGNDIFEVDNSMITYIGWN